MIDSCSAPPLFNEIEKMAVSARKSCIVAIYHAKSGHPGGSLSCIEIITSLYAFARGNCSLPYKNIILSKGHAAPALYSVAAEFNIISRSSLLSLRKMNSILQGHPHVVTCPWLGASTGSLGQGMSVALGVALALKYKNLRQRVFAIIGDGEMQEGQVWEAAMVAAHYRLGGLCVVLDYNKMQSDSLNCNIIDVEPLRARWEAFNWNVIEVDGHDIAGLWELYSQIETGMGSPTLIIAHTVKGKGVSYMEGVPAWHGSATLSADELRVALEDLGTHPDEILKYVDGSIWKKEPCL